MNFPKSNQRTGPMTGHVRKGRVFKSTLAATGVLNIEDWVKDDLPDLLWPALVMEELGNDSYRRFLEWQKGVQGLIAFEGVAGV